ncbi:ADP-heptose--LPS heptosyltransferase [Pseudalgibacter alginicilyticus]|uniref:ADP-heptose--LPS heptosyltransferase n=1 Tax=Pseudalgibacter alginicilyticus TaxID=1736674 RepID=A0A0P0CIS8_9FLAO|nr:glycosyltransferase family 9 protein [Pseudalgibacter alginicilyticus]ALJ04263.1 ADP-heptose--LPS heptosyltransferase [Pseudalgibacter alginicilyticus]
MSFSRKINAKRRKLTNALTKNVGNQSLDEQIAKHPNADIKRVLISRPNHRLGNMLLITPLVQEVIEAFPNCKIDLFVKGGVAPILFENYNQIDYIIKLPKKHFNDLFGYFKGWFFIRKYHYDLVINGDKNSSSGRLSTKLAKGTFKIFGDIDEAETSQYKDFVHIAKYPIYNFRQFLLKIGIDRRQKPMPLLNLKLSASEILKGKKILDDLVKNDKKTLALYTFATADKCYSEDWWNEFYQKLLTAFPDYNIIEVLPVENVSQLGFKALSLYSTDVREMAALFANTSMYIGADCGIMHLASAALTTTIGLFSRSNLPIYEPYGNGSIAINTQSCDTDCCIASIKEVLNQS